MPSSAIQHSAHLGTAQACALHINPLPWTRGSCSVLTSPPPHLFFRHNARSQRHHHRPKNANCNLKTAKRRQLDAASKAKLLCGSSAACCSPDCCHTVHNCCCCMWSCCLCIAAAAAAVTANECPWGSRDGVINTRCQRICAASSSKV
jgi:hypothetical protein